MNNPLNTQDWLVLWYHTAIGGVALAVGAAANDIFLGIAAYLIGAAVYLLVKIVIGEMNEDH